MKGVLIDTTSLITLAADKYPQEYPYGYRNSDKRNSRFIGQLSGIEAFLLSDNIIIDYPSYQRNLKQFPDLKQLEKIAEFININNDDEDDCYMSCTDVIVPLMIRPGNFLIDIYRRHIEFLDYCEISDNHGYAPSTYWKDLSRRLSDGENILVNALESMFGKYTPFYGAALTNLIRFLYYITCQEIYDCNLSLHYIKSYFLLDLYGEVSFNQEKYIAKNILDVFDEKYSNNYNHNFKEWIGVENSEIKIPLLIDYINKNIDSGKTLIENLIEFRNERIFVDYRDAINKLQIAIKNKDKFIINEITSSIETYTNNILKGECKDPSKRIQKIGISIPFIGGLGTEINLNIPKLNKTPGDKILVFLHKLIKSI